MSAVFLLSVVVMIFLSSVSAQFPAVCSPSQTTCTFYSTCVESAIPCGSSGYAIGYGQKFCNLFTQNFNDFDSNGQRWIDNVRYCLQNSLLPEVALAEEGQAPTCTALQSYAFASHVNCYVDPTGSNLLSDSVCALGILDWTVLLWTIKSAFVQAFSATITQMVNTLEACGSQYISQVEVSFDSTVLSATTTVSDVETAIARQVATQMNWPDTSVLAYSSGNYVIVALLATAASSSSSGVSFYSLPTSIAGDLVNLVNSGGLIATVNGQNFTLTAAVACQGACPSTMPDTADSNTNSSPLSPMWIGVTIAGGIVLIAVVAVVAFFLWRKTKQNELQQMITRHTAAPAPVTTSV
jgi:hypothetical protein